MSEPLKAASGVPILSIFVLLVSSPAHAQQLTHTCKLEKGSRAGITLNFPAAQPIPVGSFCQDGAGSTGVAFPDNPNPQVTHTCKFDLGPRAGQSQAYPQSLPVGVSCTDGAGSGGYSVRDSTTATSSPQPPGPQAPAPLQTTAQSTPKPAPHQTAPSPQPVQPVSLPTAPTGAGKPLKRVFVMPSSSVVQ